MLGSGIRWTNLHPQRLLESMKSFNFNFPFDTLDDFMKRVQNKIIWFLFGTHFSVCLFRFSVGWNDLYWLQLFLLFQAGITSAYQEKPCLDPTDPECPLSAPNKNLTQVKKTNWNLSDQKTINELICNALSRKIPIYQNTFWSYFRVLTLAPNWRAAVTASPRNSCTGLKILWLAERKRTKRATLSSKLPPPPPPVLFHPKHNNKNSSGI